MLDIAITITKSNLCPTVQHDTVCAGCGYPQALRGSRRGKLPREHGLSVLRSWFTGSYLTGRVFISHLCIPC